MRAVEALIGARRIRAVVLDEPAALAVGVPLPPVGAAENLHETDSALHQPSRRQGLPPEVGVTVKRLHRVRLVTDIEELRRFYPHAKRRLECSGARVELGLSAMVVAMEAIQLPHQIQLLALLASAEKGRGLDVRHRWISGLDVRQRGLVDTSRKPAS